MADAVVRWTRHTQTRVPRGFAGRVVAIDVGSRLSALYYDSVYPHVGRPIKEILGQVADGYHQRALGMRTIGQISALQLEVTPRLTWALEVGAQLALVAGTGEKLRRHRGGLGPGAASEAQSPDESAKAYEHSPCESRKEAPERNPPQYLT